MKIKSPKKLIEVALPLREINEACYHEKMPGIGPHPRGIHLWWARRPLAAARAVIFAQMVNDPGGERGWAKGVSKAEADARREKLFNIIREMVKWTKADDEEGIKKVEEALEMARDEIWKSWRETCALNKGAPGFDPDKLPAFHDPFAGGGALPLEAQRLGLESYASDLNPVAVMINKAMIEIPPKFAGRNPIGPIPVGESEDCANKWPGATGLAEDVRRYGYWMREEAKKRIGHLYPQVEITKEMAKGRPDLKPNIGKKLTVIAWLWARTVKSPNPKFAHVDVPLVSSFVLSAKSGKESYVKPIVEGDKWRFEVCVGKPPKGAELGTTLGKRKGFRCLLSGVPIDYNYIRDFGKKHGLAAKPFAVVLDGPKGRIYISPTSGMEEIAKSERPKWRPDVMLPDNPRDFKTPNYGLNTYAELFTDRQLVALSTFSILVQEARKKVIAGGGDEEYANAIAVYLAFAVDRAADFNNSICRWSTSNEKTMNLFARQSIPMSWDFSEVNILENVVGGFRPIIDYQVECLRKLPGSIVGSFASQADAQHQTISQSKVISTDPPYYDNIGYADLSDFFYVWMRHNLKHLYPDVFAAIMTPKEEELVATPYRHGGKDAAEAFFMDGMTMAMHSLATASNQVFPITIYYAFKQSETSVLGTSNAGWESFLEAVIASGLSITGTWPIRSEQAYRMIGMGNNALASSIVLVCRKRPENALTVSRTQFIKELRAEMHNALMDMTNGDVDHAPIAPVDLQQAAIGPGMGVYSKYREIQKMDGSRMTVHEAMLEIMKEIDAFLNPDTTLKDVDSSTRFFVEWFKVHGFDDGPFGEAQTLATAKNTTVQYVVDSDVAVSGGGKMRILNWEEYPDDPDYDPREDDNLPLWEACHRVIRELKRGSERTAAALLAKMPSKLVDGIYHLAYYLYDFCTKQGDAANARVYNELATSWEDVLRIKDEILAETEPKAVQGELELG